MKTSRSVDQRRAGIVKWVNTHGYAQVELLAAQFNTSEVTIRKDLTALADEKKLIRQFGGAAPIPQSNVETNVVNLPSSIKQSIGKLAASRIQQGSKIALDCGSTTAALLPCLRDIPNLVVMTNALDAASQLTKSNNEPTILMTGGTWDPASRSFQGAMAEQLVSAYSFDMAFIGAAGIDVSRGTTTFNELTGLTRAMARAAHEVVVMATSNKLSNKMPNLELGWNNISTLVTDNGISDEDKYLIEQQGVTVLVAAQNGE
ncbi:DeoR family transcriptional regulator [Alteromonas sp. 1_MG-2023]|uniref:DeoR/GlpR family DNA-binding transcription regulator n=1 Tax=Alteromonas sp. 1_MG-2023 TaxID=3062669 RepID=UPI0026E3D2D1|nr:DeoR family transcriptional regulator [Alteromonas sp. 1_MG-2023]MDO6566946.1 DeoR family transcriptional regulator [Alteromonas sp. 1_MG-2023]